LLSSDELLVSLRSTVTCLEPEHMSLEDASAAVAFFSEVERLAAAGKSLCARRCAEQGVHRRAGHRNPAEWLSSVTGDPLGQSIGALESAAGAAASPALDEALRRGDLSPAQSREIASAAGVDPACAGELVDKARRVSLAELRRAADEARRRAASEQSAIERLESIRRRRRLRSWVDPDGAGRIDGLFSPDDFARLRATLDPVAERLFGEARRSGRRESREALLADALVEALTGSPTGGAGSGQPDGSGQPPGAGDSGQPDGDGGAGPQPGGRAGPCQPAVALVRFVVDIEAFFRGEAAEGERCEIAGVGPVPVTTARAILGDSILELVIKDGVDVVSVTHLGRAVPNALRRALEERDPRCVVPGCELDRGLEIDHWKIDFAAGGPTELWNLARLCKAHHAMKTYRGYRLEGGPGAWRWLPPRDQSGTSPPDRCPPPDRGSSPDGDRQPPDRGSSPDRRPPDGNQQPPAGGRPPPSQRPTPRGRDQQRPGVFEPPPTLFDSEI